MSPWPPLENVIDNVVMYVLVVFNLLCWEHAAPWTLCYSSICKIPIWCDYLCDSLSVSETSGGNYCWCFHVQCKTVATYFVNFKTWSWQVYIVQLSNPDKRHYKSLDSIHKDFLSLRMCQGEFQEMCITIAFNIMVLPITDIHCLVFH